MSAWKLSITAQEVFLHKLIPCIVMEYGVKTVLDSKNYNCEVV